jgi:hypothetical protein
MQAPDAEFKVTEAPVYRPTQLGQAGKQAKRSAGIAAESHLSAR